MQDYFLVLDTETSGLPKKWNAPYSAKSSWPHVLQIAWLIYDKDRNLLKQENHYLKPGDFKITKASAKVHKITKEFLQQNGKDRLAVFEQFIADVKKYNPLIVAHFAELDYCMVGAETYRLNAVNPLKNSPIFCTLRASATYVKNPAFKFLKLNVFYKTLFKKRPENLHNALVDAQLTAEIFFHLLSKQEVTEQVIDEHSHLVRQSKQEPNAKRIQFYIFIIIVLIVVIVLILWKTN